MGGVHKPALELEGRPILQWALAPFLAHSRLGQVVVAVPADQVETARGWVGTASRVDVVAGGATRRDSVARALSALDPRCSIVLVHDGARPFVQPEWIDACLAWADRGDGAVVGVPVTDTIKRVQDNRIVETPTRADLWRAQTPQAFPRPMLEEAYAHPSSQTGTAPTDDASLVERVGGTVHMVLGDESNLKVTRPLDLVIAESLARGQGS